MAPIAIDLASLRSVRKSATAPTLNYDDWTGDLATISTKDMFINQLRQVCTGLGFFYLSNTPLDDPQSQRRDKIFQLNKDFFSLPFHVRSSIDMENSRHFRGFAKFGDERTLNKVDHRDQVDYGIEVDPVDKELRIKFPFLNLHGRNQFLSDEILPGHKDQVLQWFQICTQISHELTSALEKCIGAQPGQLLQYLQGIGGLEPRIGKRPYARMKTIRYPLGPNIDGVKRLENSTQGVGAHRDGGWITILATSPHPGLQVESLSGEWLDVPYREGSVIINFGQQIERVAKGVIRAATHRVLSNPSANSNDRYSVAYFIMPALNAIVKPVDMLSPEIVKAWQKAQEERKNATGKADIVSLVPQGDLWGDEEEAFGYQAWKGIIRSHPNVFNRWYAHK